MPDHVRTGWNISTAGAPSAGYWTTPYGKLLIYSARSNHSGGVNLLLGDGSARFISDTINSQVWMDMSTPKAFAGETVGNF